ncbi:MAG: DinB family protein [Anaerolineae bacterium]|nr:DinB family protein [Anaerolineae bacterium]
MKLIQKPEPGEYATYGSTYVRLVPDDGRVLHQLRDSLQVVQTLARRRSVEQLTTPHAPGEWTIQEILVHILDTERIFAYRALRFARGDTTELPGYDPNPYAALSGANQRDIEDILEEYWAVRQATLTLLNSLDDDALLREGVASGNRVTVRAIAYFIAGHELHHLASIGENYG